MKKTLVALLLALCMVTSLTAATACCVDSGRAETTGMEKPMTMEETCPCMMDGKGVNGCQCNGDKCGKDCMGGVCGDDCMCMDGKPCMKDGMRMEGCSCIEKKLELLEGELNALFETNMELWNKFFGMMNKQPDMNMSYADYLMEQLEMARKNFTEEEYALLEKDIETIRRIDNEIAMLQAMLAPEEDMMAGKCMKDDKCVSECACEAGSCTEACDCMKDEMYQNEGMNKK